MSAGRVEVGGAGEHASQLGHPVRVCNSADFRGCVSTRDDDLAISPGGHLGEMGDDNHLRVSGKGGQARADSLRRFSTHPGINLVEYECRRNRWRCLGKDELDGEHDAGQFSARGGC